jgi:adhesin transport system outer membrane protein
MNLWSGWRIQSEVERAQSVHESRRQQQRITRDEVAFFVVEAYLNWTRTRELVRLSQENLAAHERLTRDVQEIAAVDQGRRIDVDQALVRTENARLSLEQRRAENQVFAQRLKRMLLGRLPQHPDGFQSIKGVLPKSTDQALAMLTDAHPVIAQQRAQIQSAEAGVKNAKSGFSPRVDLAYQRQTAQGSGQGDYIAQLNVQIPLFDGGAAYGSTRSAYAELDAAKYELSEATATLRENVLSSWAEFLSAKQRAVLGKKQVVNAIQLVKGYDEQFRVGRRSLLDLLTIQDNLYSYQTNANNAAFEERIAKARILAILNRLASTYLSNDSAYGHSAPPPAEVKNSPAASSDARPATTPSQITTQFGSSTNMRTEHGQ